MKRILPLLLLILLPSMALAQGLPTILNMYGPVEVRQGAAPSFRTISADAGPIQIRVGDEIRTGPQASMTLGLPDGSYMVISENSTLRIQDTWSSNSRSIVDIILGKVRFFVQRRNQNGPYRVGTPTALIAVRGTTFEVTVADASFTEVWCFEGSVAVETAGLPAREVILDAGWKTLVQAGEAPLMPVRHEETIRDNRVLRVVNRTPIDDLGNGLGTPLPGGWALDNDRRLRGTDGLSAPPSQIDSDALRAKPSLTYPE